MPKPLVKTQPTSSVAGMLEPGIGAQAMSKPIERRLNILPTPIAEQVPPVSGERVIIAAPMEKENILRQFGLTADSDRILKKIVSVYSDATSLDLKNSEFLRSFLIAVEHALPELEREAQAIGRLKRPKNDRDKKGIQQQMERQIAKAIVAGMRAVATLD